MKFSVIIPTMWRSARTLNLLRDLDACKYVDEIILIDNDPSKVIDLSEFKKLKYFTKNKNIFVNPAWNWGVELSKNELISICNDDINFEPDEIFKWVLTNQNGLGTIGMHAMNYHSKNEKIGYQSLVDTKDINFHLKGNGFGTLMFVKKSKWVPIPNQLKIWYGDDWIIRHNGQIYALRTTQKMETEMYTTSSAPELSTVINNDINEWNSLTNKIKKVIKISYIMQSYLGKYPGSRSDSDKKFLRAVQSFIDQEDKNSELIIVSDSCEITHKLYNKHFKKDTRIKYAYIDKDVPNMYEGDIKYYRGMPRQVGRSLVTGEITTYMDSDDFLMKDSTTKLKSVWNNAYDKFDVLTNISWYDNIKAFDFELEYDQLGDPDPISIDGLDGKWYSVKLPKDEKTGEISFVRSPWLTSHKSEISTKWRDTNGENNINISEDVDFSIRLFKENRVAYMEHPVYVRCHYKNRWDI